MTKTSAIIMRIWTFLETPTDTRRKDQMTKLFLMHSGHKVFWNKRLTRKDNSVLRATPLDPG